MDSIFSGASSAPGFSYADQRTWNVWRGGEILEDYTISQRRKFDHKTGKPSDEPDFYDDGNPKNQMSIPVQSEERDHGSGDDGGVRRIFIPIAGLKKPGSKLYELVQALSRADAPGPRVGGYLYELKRGEEPGEGTIPRGLWSYHYVPPAQDPGRQMDSALQQWPSAPQQPAPPAAPTQNGYQPNPAHQQGTPPPPAYRSTTAPQGPPAPPPAPAQQPAYAQAGPPQQQPAPQQYASPPPPPQPGHNPYA